MCLTPRECLNPYSGKVFIRFSHFYWLSSVSYAASKYQVERPLFKILTDPLIRRFLSGTLFAAAFIWLAIYFFDVETEVLRVLAIMSGLLVLLLIGTAFIFSFVVKFFRRSNGGMLDKIDLIESEVKADKVSKEMDARDVVSTADDD